MKRRWIIGLFLLPLLMIPAGLAFFTCSEQGGRQLAGMAARLSGGALGVDDVSGRLVDTWRLEGVHIRTVDIDLNIKIVEVQWQPPAILRGEVRMTRVYGQGIDLLIKEDVNDTSPFVLPGLTLPVNVVMDRVELRDFFIHDNTGFEMALIEQVTGRLAGQRRQIFLQEGEISFSGAAAQAEGSMKLDGKWPLDLRGGLRIDVSQGHDAAPLAADFIISGVLSDPVAEVDLKSPASAKIHLVCTDLFDDTRWQGETTVAELGGRDILSLWGVATATDADGPDLQFTDVRIEVSGTTDGYQGTARMLGGWTPSAAWPHLASLPPMEIDVDFAGDSEGFQVPSLAAKLPYPPDKGGQGGCELTARGMVGWRDDVNWLVELAGRDVELEPYLPGWTGRVDAEINIGGRLHGDVVSGEIELAALDGDLLGYPLSGGGQVRMDEKGVRVEQLRLQSGDSELEMSGEAGERLALQVRCDVKSLGNLWPEAAGAAHFQGTIAGSRETPEFSFRFDGAGLSYNEIMVQTLTGSGKGVFSPQGGVELEVAGKDLQMGSARFSTLAVDVDGVMAAHRLRATLTGPAGDVKADLGGILDMTDAPAWRGELRGLLARLDPYGAWRLKEPASLRVDDQGVTLASVCLVQGESALCVEGDWQGFGDGSWRLNGDLDSFACGLLYQWRLLPYPMTGKLAAQLRLQGEGARLVRGDAGMSVPELQMTVQDEDGREQRLRWTNTRLSMELADSRLTTIAKTRFQDDSSIDAAVRVDGFGDLASSWAGLPLQGEIGLDIKELTPLAFLSDYMVKPTGSMKGAFALSGRVGSPTLSGELRQINGNLFVPATGITLEELYLSVMMKGEKEGMALMLTADSGAGQIRVTGNAGRGEDGWRVDVNATGRDFELAHLTEYEIIIDPNLHLVMDKGLARVSGRVLVPRAMIAVNKEDGSVSASDDIVFLDEKDKGKKTLPLSGMVTVELGKEVNVDSFGLKGRMEGSVTVSAAPGHPLTGQGNLTVHDGIYVLRDRALEISRGHFSFLGGSLDNPGIDMLAQRKNNNKTVGLQVSGTIDDMEVKLFSDPPMAEGEILTALLSGRPYSGSKHQVSTTVKEATAGVGLKRGGDFLGDLISGLEGGLPLDDIYMESGAGTSDVSLIVGKELFRDLYISYGYDPFKAAGIFRARYDLWKRFSVETEVGADQTGADLLWSIEK